MDQVSKIEVNIFLMYRPIPIGGHSHNQPSGELSLDYQGLWIINDFKASNAGLTILVRQVNPRYST